MDDHRRLQSTVVGAPEVRVRTVAFGAWTTATAYILERRGRAERESASQASEVDELTKTGMGVAGEGEHRYACYMRKSGVYGWMDDSDSGV